ncbi:50S ribosomal protein L29 [Pyrodictium delaneyi]|uniref:Large ribosomal subunit protein uL29 n=1 Tax=Pyrodictium delaneyi TaxID=1273541 RepID=A0A211YRX2_9CREN|nr:50S ribosomal protein L29 [Pyrodictium delaneyi]OWJ55759.1 50S ribosomal protein L29 [Pyrodictium delaneyi]
MKTDDIRKMSAEERLKKLEELREELVKLRLKAAVGTLENPGAIRAIRKTIARILTVMREEELANQRGAGSKA